MYSTRQNLLKKLVNRELAEITLSYFTLLLMVARFDVENIKIMSIPIFTAFIMHELGHRQVARKLGYFAQFEIYWKWFFGAIILSAMTLFKFIIFAPGAVVVYTDPYITPKENYEISVAGPFMNLIFGTIGIIWLVLTGSIIAFYTAGMNFFIGLFNLIPVGMLDGTKIFKYSKRIWVMLTIYFVLGFTATVILGSIMVFS